MSTKLASKQFAVSLAPPTTPFWAMRASDDVAFDHSGIYSYAVWCGIAQLWLDDISTRR
ncbi:hypothetical protein [Paracoccus sp. JM45]|uniref:hypothetical protein n=1 Tax=Paracoccus sp. JM45 TaxID=2283626 RepID=UPI001600D9A8|nr:hypothetical protein [Paracoccus sp. JM45]